MSQRWFEHWLLMAGTCEQRGDKKHAAEYVRKAIKHAPTKEDERILTHRAERLEQEAADGEEETESG